MKSIRKSFIPQTIIGVFFLIGLASCNKDDENMAAPTTIKDFDGNEYTMVKIGDQVWLKENLKTTHFNDGTPIAHLEENEPWLVAQTGAYSWYNNKPENKNAHGALYNAGAAKSGKVCPAGWRVPDHLDWFRLQDYASKLEGTSTGNLREPGDQFWNVRQGSHPGYDRTGFSARGSGIRDIDGSFILQKEVGSWWVGEENYHGPHWGKVISPYNEIFLNIIETEPLGMSIRCIKAD